MNKAAETATRKRPSVVIVGAGFGGLNAAHILRNAPVDVTLIDRNNFHTFQPLLYQVATAALAPEQVGASVRSIFRRQTNLTFKMNEVTGADWDAKTLMLDDGSDISYDYLIVGAGTVANYFGIEGMEENSWPLYTLTDSMKLRQHLLWRLEEGARNHRAEMNETVVVVGAGPTGAETAGALTSMAHDLLGVDEAKLHVVLIEALPHVLPAFTQRSRDRALIDLRRRGVDVRLGTAVERADHKSVTLKGGEVIETGTIIWAAGVSASPLGATLGLETGRRGSIIVGRDLQVAGKPGVFAVGDCAFVSPEPESGQPPLLAPNAIQGGRHAARQIMRLMKGKQTRDYEYLDKGIMAVLGRGNAVAELPSKLKRLGFGGRVAWLVWLGVHIIYLVGFRNRLKVMIDWGWNYFTSRGSAAIMLRTEELQPRAWKQ